MGKITSSPTSKISPTATKASKKSKLTKLKTTLVRCPECSNAFYMSVGNKKTVRRTCPYCRILVNMEILQDWRKITKKVKHFAITKKGTEPCPKCYGKGYSTQFQGDSFCMADFIGDKTYRTRKSGIRVNLCDCGRGRDLQLFFTIKKQFKS